MTIIFYVERRLAKVQGKTNKSNESKVKSKNAKNSGLVEHLNAIRDGVMERFLAEQQQNPNIELSSELIEDLSHDVLSQDGVLNAAQRRLFPHRVALTAEELQRLLEADILARLNPSEPANDVLPHSETTDEKND